MEEKENAAKYILLIEDCCQDFEIISRSLHKVAPARYIRCFESGEEALQFLHYPNGNLSENMELPGIILLDLNLPGTDGRDILKIIKNEQTLKSIPVIIFSTSDNEKDIKACFRDGANAYIKKPSLPEDFINTMRIINQFWFEYGYLPPN